MGPQALDRVYRQAVRRSPSIVLRRRGIRICNWDRSLKVDSIRKGRFGVVGPSGAICGAGVLAICGLDEKPPAGRRRHEELAFCDKIRSFRPPSHIVVGNAG